MSEDKVIQPSETTTPLHPHSNEPDSSTTLKVVPFGNVINTLRIKLPPCNAEHPIRVKHVILHVSSTSKLTQGQIEPKKPFAQLLIMMPSST